MLSGVFQVQNEQQEQMLRVNRLGEGYKILKKKGLKRELKGL